MKRPLKVIVVDDDQDVLESIQKLLQRSNYNVLSFRSSRAALAEIRANGADVVLTDLMMSEMDGLELMKAIREVRPQIPIIMITGYATIHTARHAMKLGAFDHLAKPFSNEQLQDVVGRAAERVLAAEKAAAEMKDTPRGG